MKFTKIITIDINHTYFNSRPFYDLSIQPTPACARLLRNYSMVFNNKSCSNVFVALQQENDVPVQTAISDFFEFLVFVADNNFVSYTKLIPAEPGKVYCYSNVTAAGKPSANLIPSLVSKSQINGYGNKNVFGVIRVYCNTAFPIKLNLNFEAADVNWRYYLIANNNFKNLAIDGKLAKITFVKTEVDANTKDEVVNAINSNFPGANLSIFQSQKAIPYQQLGIKNIQLINADNNSVLINHLPNPGFKENGIKIINTLN